MATVTVTETDVTIQVKMTRDENNVDRVFVTALSIVDVPQVNGRMMRDVDITNSLTGPQLASVANVLSFVEAQVKAQWQIP